MSNYVGKILEGALNGGYTPPPATHRVYGVNFRGDKFSLDRPYDVAVEFAAEIRSKGGKAYVNPLP